MVSVPRFTTLQLIVWAYLLITYVSGVIAQGSRNTSPKPLSPVEFFSLPRLKSPQISPDGKILAYLEEVPDWKRNRRVLRLRFRNLVTDEEIKGIPDLKKGRNRNHGSAFWHPDGKRLITVMRRRGTHVNTKKRQAYMFTISTGKLDRLTDYPRHVRSVRVSPDGKRVFFRSNEIGSRKLGPDLLMNRITQPLAPDNRKELLAVNIASGTVTTIVAAKEGSVSEYHLSRSLLLYRGKFWKGGELSYKRGIRLRNLAHSKTAPLTLMRNYRTRNVRLSPDNKYFAFIASVNDREESNYEENLFVQKVGALKPRLLMKYVKGAVNEFEWNEGGDGFFIIMGTGLRAQLYSVSVEVGALPIALTNGDHRVSSYQYVRGAGIHCYRLSSSANPGEIYSMKNGGKSGSLIGQQITQVYKKWLSSKALPKTAAVSWDNKGTKIEGILVYPIGYKKGKRYPLVTISHGGPTSSSQFGSGWRKSAYAPVLAGLGYMVFMPNYRGGEGNGDNFQRDMKNNYFRNSHLDVISGVETMIQRGLAERKQLITMGYSAGGLMTNYLITFTNMFAAASSSAGVCEWASMYGTSDTRRMLNFWFGTAPWAKGANLESYVRSSPYFLGWKVKTPTLFFSGEDDERVPHQQGVMMHRAVKETKTATEMYLMSNEDHRWTRPYSHLFKANTELAWFAKYTGSPKFEADLPVV